MQKSGLQAVVLASGTFLGVLLVGYAVLSYPAGADAKQDSGQMILTGAVTDERGSVRISPTAITSDRMRAILQDPLQALTTSERARFEKRQFIAVVEGSAARQQAEASIAGRGGEVVRSIDMGESTGIIFRLDDPSRVGQVREAVQGRVYEDRLMYAQAARDATISTVKSEEAGELSGGIMVGVIDTGVDAALRSQGSLPAVGPDEARQFVMFQPWQRERSFPITAPGGSWLNVTVSWGAALGSDVSPSDLDLELRDENGALVARSAVKGASPQVERIELYVPEGPERTYQATVSVTPDSPRTLKYYIDFFEDFAYKSAFTVRVEAGVYPRNLALRFTGETTVRPPGVPAGIKGVYKLAQLQLQGQTYAAVMSDVLPDATCYDSGGLTVYGAVGYDTIAIDQDHDGDYGDTIGTAWCNSQPFILAGAAYALDPNYSTYEKRHGVLNGRPFEDFYRFMTPVNDIVVGIEQYWQPGNPAFAGVRGPVDAQEDFLGHGTHVAGIVRAAAPDARIYAAKVFGNGPFAAAFCFALLDYDGVSCGSQVGVYESDVIAGTQQAIQAGARVINLSLGGSYQAPTTCDDFALVQYLRTVVADGIVVVASAGNGGPSGNTIIAPGCMEEAITVGALGTFGNVPNYSSRGPTREGLNKPDLVALGGDDQQFGTVDNVMYLFPSGVASRESGSAWSYLGVTNRAKNGGIRMSGTSMAAPQVSGAAARLLALSPQLTPAEIKDLLMNTATDLGLSPEEQGAGALDVLRAINQLPHAPPEAKGAGKAGSAAADMIGSVKDFFSSR